MLPPDSARTWDEQRATLRALVFGERSPTTAATDAFFARTEWHHVSRTSARVASDLLTRQRRGARSIPELFAGTLAGVPAELRVQLPEQFRRSRWFATYGELPERADQRSVEEAFYRFLCDRGLGDPAVRRAELADALISALAVQPRPAFSIPSEIERAPFGYFALVDVGGRTLLFAATGERLLRGPVDPAVAAVLRHRGRRPDGSQVSRAAWNAALERLAALGLSPLA